MMDYKCKSPFPQTNRIPHLEGQEARLEPVDAHHDIQPGLAKQIHLGGAQGQHKQILLEERPGELCVFRLAVRPCAAPPWRH